MRLSVLMTMAIFFMFGPSMGWAQDGVKILEMGPVADPSAVLDIESTNKGILLPRMSSADSGLSQEQRDTLRKAVDEVKKHLGESQARDLSSAKTIAELKGKIAVHVKTCAPCGQLKALETSLKTGPTPSSKKK